MSKDEAQKMHDTFYNLREQLIMDERTEAAFYKAAAAGVLGSITAEKFDLSDKIAFQGIAQMMDNLFRGADRLDGSNRGLGALSPALVAYVAAKRILVLRRLIETDAHAD
ncbi:MAG: hypothetical protein ACRYGR_01920, partial [Janthinobacterium lividum]